MRHYVTPPLGLPQIHLGFIPKGYLGTQTTLKHIQALIRSGAKDFYVRQKAIDILLEKAVKPKDYLGEIKVLFEWVQQNVRYTKDPFRVEVLHSARRLLELRAGDCDDFTILLGSMLEAIGHPVRLVVTGPDPLRPKLFSHIYVEAFHQGRWVALDATMPYPMGWEPRTVVKQVISMDRKTDMMQQPPDLSGMAAMPRPPLVNELSNELSNELPGLIQSIQRGGLKPQDPRLKLLIDVLRQRQLLRRKPRLAKRLQFIWKQGLSARPYPKTARWLERSLQRWGLLTTTPAALSRQPPPQSRRQSQVPVPQSPVPGQQMQPVSLRPVPGVKVQPIAQVTRR